MKIQLQEKIERWKDKAELFIENNIQCFIKTLDGAYYSSDILFVGENWVYVYDFVKKDKYRIFWLDVILFEEFKNKEEGK